jgi:lysophospholipase L1-like esterase
MRSNKLLAVALCVGTLLSFTYGVLTGRYHLFPYDYLKMIKGIVAPVESGSARYSQYYYHKKSFFEQHGGTDYQVVFIGDSLIGFAEWQDLFPSLKVANRGIGGDGTDGILNRLESICSTAAPKAFIMVGINDLAAGMGVNKVIYNYEKIVKELIDQGAEVYIQSTILTGKNRGYLNREVRALNERLQLLAGRTASTTYIDLNAYLAPDLFLDEKYSRDGLHLNGEGYAVWREIIKPHLPQADGIR